MAMGKSKIKKSLYTSYNLSTYSRRADTKENNNNSNFRVSVK